MMKLNNPVRAAIFCVLALVALFFGVYFGIQAFTSKPSTRSFNVGASLGSKSPYPIGNYSSYQGSCKLVQVQMYCRHGVRYGTSKNLQNMFDLARMFRGNSSKINDSKLSNLTVPFPEDQPGELAPIGFQNLKDFGKRWLTRYPQLVNLQSISLRSSNSSRVMNSAESFMKGLLDGQAPSVNNSIIGDRATDADINPTISCSKYMVEENLHEAEAKSFKSLAFTSMAERISKRIGFQLSLDQSLTLLDLCIAQIGLLEYNTTDGVCYLFEQKDFQNYGLLDNVDKYYSLGYGHSINTQMTCSAWTGIYNEMKNARKKGPSMSLRFTHAETITPLVASLGLFNDTVSPTGSMPFDSLMNNQFQISKISPFQSNIIFEVYECEQDGLSLRILLNENQVDIPNLRKQADGLYSFKDFFKKYKSLIECDYDQVCGNRIQTFGGWNSK